MRLLLPQLTPHDLGRPKFRRRNPVLEGIMYAFRQSLFDVYQVTANTALDAQELFTKNRGASYTPTGGTAYTKKQWHTNMPQAGLLPSPQKHYVKSIQLAIRPDTDPGDATRFLYDTLVTFKISDHPYLITQAFRLPQAGGLYGGSSAIVSNGQPLAPNFFICEGDFGEVLEQQQGVSVELDPTQVKDAAGNGTYTLKTAANGGNGINCFVHLDGILNREVKG